MIDRVISPCLLAIAMCDVAFASSVWDVQNNINSKIQSVINRQDLQPSDISNFLERLSDTDDFSTTDLTNPDALVSPAETSEKNVTWSAEHDIELVPLELVLSNLSIQMGANFHVSLRLAQADPQARVLIIRSGNFSLADLKKLADERLGEGLITFDDDAYTAHLPLFIWQSGRLEIGEGDTLLLDQSVGSFLANSGALNIHSGAVASNNANNSKLDEFRPFITTALMGYTQITDAKLSDLGFEGYRALKGVSFSSSPFFAPLGKSYIKSSVLDAVGSLELNGIVGFDFSQNVITGSASNGVEIRESSAIKIARNVFLDSGNHGIKISDGSYQVTISQNAVLKSKGNGIYMSNGSNIINVSSNILAQNARSGLSVQRVACLDAHNNLIASNLGSGIVIDTSFGVDLYANKIVTNKVGTKISDRIDLGDFTLHGNTFIANGMGVSGSRATGILFSKNDFSMQLPKILGGEFGQYTNAYLDALAAQKTSYEIPKQNLENSLLGSSMPVLAIDRCLEKKGM